MSKLKLSSIAPTFKLLNQNSEIVSLKDLFGKKVVLYFYPKAMTPGCTTQAQCLRDSKKIFEKLNTVVLGVSPDEPKKLLKFIEKEKNNFDLLSDVDQSLCLAYDVWGLKKFMGREYMGVKRTTFIIDEHGKLAFILENVKTKTHHNDVLEIIKNM